ncbi:MAG TPA: phosphomannomutase/phosphoglucomutase [Candidatus Krumholzibacteriaceae bacterium]|nr:phosphomannomutase/phosphoglucomutase [Candidatus Krumholzibacteriaceae bacterium]
MPVIRRVIIALPEKIFREYDIRGVVDEDLTDDGVRNLGKAAAVTFLRDNIEEVIVGRDIRLSSERFFNVLAEGLLSSGVNIIDIGVVPTPVFYFAAKKWDKQGGIIITASHNSAEFNGFKILRGEGTIYGEDIRELHSIIVDGRFREGKGSLIKRDVRDEYIDYLCENIDIKRPVKFAIDGGNGTAGIVALDIFRKLGLEPVELFMRPDGNFPNHHPDPTVEHNLIDLKAAVAEGGLELGIGFDGDSDRIGVIDEEGNVLWGDALLALYARDMLKNNPGATVIFEVKCSRSLDEDIRNYGGNPIMWKTGHSLLKKKMRDENALLAGEMSGHQFFSDRYFGYDDAIYAALRLLEIVSKREKPLSDFYREFSKYKSTPEIRIECEDARKFDIVREVSDHFKKTNRVMDVDGARVDFEEGWGLIRASNTQPALVFRFEAETEKALIAIREEFSRVLEKFKLDTSSLFDS